LRPPRLLLDLSAVRHNVAAWREHVGDREVWAVVKSDAYGLGAVDVARACIDAGAARLVVFDVEEARPLRAAGIAAPIVHVFATQVSDMPAALTLDVTPSIEDAAGARALSEIAQWRLRRVNAHVAIDSGTGWSGVPASRAAELGREIRDCTGVVWEGAWTQVAGRDSMDAQMRAFATAVAALREEGVAVPVLHAAATGPLLWGRSTGAVRIGAGLYGSVRGEMLGVPELHTAIDVRATIIAVKTFDGATPLGYGGKSVAEPGARIATLRVGYADGLPPAIADGGGVALINGAACPIAGAIGMNCTMVRVPAGADAKIGDDAMIVGDADGVRLDEVTSRCATIPHVLLTALAAGMPRPRRRA